MAFIGPCDHPPSEAMIEELEAELDALRRERIYGNSDAQVLDTVRARRVVVMWKLPHKVKAASLRISARYKLNGGRTRSLSDGSDPRLCYR